MEIWIAIFQSAPIGSRFLLAMQLLITITEDQMREAYNRIDTETTLGPLICPTAYIDGTRLKNARDYQRVLKAAAELRKILPQEPVVGIIPGDN